MAAEYTKLEITVGLAKDTAKIVVFGLLTASAIDPTILRIRSSSSTSTTPIPLYEKILISFCGPDVVGVTYHLMPLHMAMK